VQSRGVAPRPANSAGNGLIWVVTDAAEEYEKETVHTIAKRVRRSLLKARDPSFAAAYGALNAEKALAAINAELAQDFIPRSGNMVVNSSWRYCLLFRCHRNFLTEPLLSPRYDWTSAHFGYPGQTRFFHTLLDEPRYVKIFQPNPTRMPDGTWETHPGDAEVTFYLHREVWAAFLEIFKTEARALGVSGEIEILDTA
jgi:hypothetical protein